VRTTLLASGEATVSNWPVALLVAAATLMFRGQGDPWPNTIAKAVAIGMLFLGVVALGDAILRRFV
jgi:hypothetical protein